MSKFSFRQVLTGFIVSLLLVFTVFYFSYTSISNLQENEKAVARTLAVIKTSIVVQALLLDCETGQRGYIATGKEKFLEPYNKSVSLIPASLTDLRLLITDNPVQLQNLDSLTYFANLKTREVGSVIEIARLKGFDTARKVLSTSAGLYDMDRARFWVSQMVKEENRLLKTRIESSDDSVHVAVMVLVGGGVIILCVILFLSLYIRRSFTGLLDSEENTRVSKAELEKVLDENTAKNWLLTGTRLLNEKMLGQQSEKELAENILAEICDYTKAVAGTFYLYNENDQSLDLYASYAFHNLDTLKKSFRLGEGWVGQATKNKKAAIIKGKLNDKVELTSSIIHQDLLESVIVPFFFDEKFKGVIELAFYDEIGEAKRDFILNNANGIGVAVNTAQARTIVYDLLSQVQQQTEELETQQEEMRLTNEELLNKTEMLQASEEELRVQQEELRTANAELEEKADLLEKNNWTIEGARQSINNKVKELETSGRYKSEFLANMSHELRTPLNSILVLARILKDNKPANLSEDQIKYAGVIFSAGNDLLTLINDILDLSKIESGKLELHNEEVRINDILQDMEMLFAEFAHNKKIKYTVNAAPDIQEHIFTDKVRVEQVLKNLLSNAFKFTPEKGSIAINVIPGTEDQTISFCIKDSGIGIALDKQKIIFEAFQQADGSTSRKYGGTGLGLSISRELVALLGGNITVISEPGKGSEFILSLPLKPKTVVLKEKIVKTTKSLKPNTDFLKPAHQITKPYNREPLVIIVEDDKNFADILHDYSRDHGYRSIIINEGTNAFEIIKENQPDAVILDIMLPSKDGWQILKELKQDEDTSDIPVHLMSADEAASANRIGLEGAISFIRKPIAIETIDQLFTDIMLQSGIAFKQILLVEDNKEQSHALNELMLSLSITVDQAFDGESAFNMLLENEYQCLILDINLPDISGLDFLDKIKKIDRFKSLPVIINTAMELDKKSVSRLMKYANAMVMKTDKTPDRLIDEVNLFLNKVRETTWQPKEAAIVSKNKMITMSKDAMKGKKILVVDDDMRNVFALSSALQSYDMHVEIAHDGQEAIDKLEEIADIDLVLMDIMMPVMDGYDATRFIRKQNKYAKLPVIALTAKAMMDDRDKCMAAGANDYITKPIDVDRLIALMQLWLGS
jgi:CheY-like chemotaxis protein/CHASE3 domain sensor protein